MTFDPTVISITFSSMSNRSIWRLFILDGNTWNDTTVNYLATPFSFSLPCIFLWISSWPTHFHNPSMCLPELHLAILKVDTHAPWTLACYFSQTVNMSSDLFPISWLISYFLMRWHHSSESHVPMSATSFFFSTSYNTKPQVWGTRWGCNLLYTWCIQ